MNEQNYTEDELEVISKAYDDHARRCADYYFGRCKAYGGNCIGNCGWFANFDEIVERVGRL